MSFWKSLGSAVVDVASGRRPVWSVAKSSRTIRVAVVGGKKCGKTVFLTALANHLREHRRGEFPIGGQTIYWNQHAITGNEYQGMPQFDYVGAKLSLKNGMWPEKTADTSILSMQLLIEDASRSKRENVLFEVLDMPGERISDCPMMGRSYKEWCRWREEVFAGPGGSSPAYREYLERTKDLGTRGEHALLDAYRDFIAYEYGHYTSDVTPSTLSLELDGTKHGGSPSEFRATIGNLPIGFKDKNGNIYEFAPLPMSCFDKTSPFYQLSKKFDRAYDEYVKRVIRPMERWLRGAQKMIYLVDVLTLLQSGADAWEAEKKYADAAIGALCPHVGNILGRTWRYLKNVFWRTQINAVYVVATKSDLVVSNSDRTNLKKLVDELVGRTLPFLANDIKTATFSCAAICSTKEVVDDTNTHGLQGMLNVSGSHPPDYTLEQWIPSSVPDTPPASSREWQDQIDAGEFNYQFSIPFKGTGEVRPPLHFGLNVIANELLIQ